MSEDFTQLRVVDLKILLQEAGLPVSGRKTALIKRLKDAGVKPPKKGRRRRSKSLSPVRCTKGRGKRVYYFDPDTGKRISKAEANRRKVEKCVTVSQRKQERKKTPKRKPTPKPPTRLPEPVKVIEVTEPPTRISLAESILIQEEMVPPTAPFVSPELLEMSTVTLEDMVPDLSASLATTELDVFETAKSQSEALGDTTGRFAIVTAYIDPVWRVTVPKEFKGEETVSSPENLEYLYERYGIDPLSTREMLLLVPPSQLDEVLSLGDKFRNPPEENVQAVVEEIQEKLPEMAIQVTVYDVVTAYRDPVYDVFVPLEVLGREFLNNFDEIDRLYEKYEINPIDDRKYLFLVPPTRLLDVFDLAKEFLEPPEEDPTPGAEALREKLPKIAVLITPKYAVLTLLGSLAREKLFPYRYLGEESLLSRGQAEALYEKYGIGPNETREYILVTFPTYADNLLELGKLYLDPKQDLELILNQIRELINRVGMIILPPGMTLYSILTAVKDDQWGIYIPNDIIDIRPLNELQELNIGEGKAYEFYRINPDEASLFLVSEKDGLELLKFTELFLKADTDSQKQKLIEDYEPILPTIPMAGPIEIAESRKQK